MFQFLKVSCGFNLPETMSSYTYVIGRLNFFNYNLITVGKIELDCLF